MRDTDAPSPLLADLQEKVRGGRALLVVGAGVSVATSRAEVASWQGLLDHGISYCSKLFHDNEPEWAQAQRLLLGLGHASTMVQVAQAVQEGLGGVGSGEFEAWLRATVGSLTVEDATLIKAMAALGCPIVTTNYDSLLTEVTGLPAVTWERPGEVQRLLQGDGEGIIHVHGHWEKPTSVILGTLDYGRVRDSKPAQALQQVMATMKTLVFIGCGSTTQDPNLGALLRWLGDNFSASEYRHYRLERTQDVPERQKEHPREHRIFPLGYGDRFEDLPGFLLEVGGIKLEPDEDEDVGADSGDGGDGGAPPPPHSLQKVHAQLEQNLGKLAGFFSRLGGPTTLDEVYVELSLQGWAEGRGARLLHAKAPTLCEDGTLDGPEPGRPLRLRQVIDLPHKRWVLLGDPGSGKTTLLHHLSLDLLREVRGDDAAEGARSPIFFKLSELETGWGLRQAVTACYGEDFADPVQEAAGRGALVILLDGLDEAVDPLAARSAIACICAEAPQCQIIVTSRYTGYQDHPLAAPFETLTLRPLEEPQQRRLLNAWGIDTARITTTLRHLHGRPRLKAIAETPLLLTLVALILREKPDATLPSRRGELYRMALSQFLLREFSPNHPGKEGKVRALRSSELAEEALGVVALELHAREGAAYAQRDIRKALRKHADLFEDINKTWGDVAAFLKEVAECTGIIEPDTDSRGASKAWRFPHRTFREYLAAWALSQDITAKGLGEVPRNALEGAGLEKREGKAAKAPGKLGEVLKAATEHPATWSEVLALTCGLEVKPGGAGLIVRWVALTGNPELVLRVVAEAENIREDTVWAVLGLESGGRKWNQRKEVLEQLPALVRDGSAVIRLVDKLLRQTTSGNDLYFARELLQQLAAGEVEGDGAFILTEGDRAQAAALAGDVLKRHRPEAREEAKAILEGQWISIEGGRFRMGSEDGHANERPVREVTLSSYRLQKVPVTNALYERFDPGHRQERSFADRVKDSEELDRHPVVDVTWYEARMFAEWAGVSLPTEAQWEYGARGPDRADRRGREHPWGDGEPTEKLANFEGKVGHTTPVGTYPDGASWCGALDMAGNVREWCGDWYRPYDPTQTDDPTGPPDGSFRVLRGGSWRYPADWLRGAYRNWFLPGDRYVGVGFRLVAPPVAAFDPV